jgi:hypothetical protein
VATVITNKLADFFIESNNLPCLPRPMGSQRDVVYLG